METKQETGIARAVALAGNQGALALALNVSQQAVSAWETQGFVPLERAKGIAELYGIPRRELINPRILSLVEAD